VSRTQISEIPSVDSTGDAYLDHPDLVSRGLGAKLVDLGVRVNPIYIYIYREREREQEALRRPPN